MQSGLELGRNVGAAESCSRFRIACCLVHELGRLQVMKERPVGIPACQLLGDIFKPFEIDVEQAFSGKSSTQVKR